MVNKATNKIEKVEAEKITISDDEPSWYHYIIVLAIFASIFLVFYGVYYFFYNEPSLGDIGNLNNSLVLTKYPYVKGNVTYNLYFHNSISEIENMDFPVEINKLDLLNTQNFIMVFYDYNGTDNGQVTLGSTKLVSFLKTVYNFNFDETSFVKINQTDCSNSTLNSKVIIFNPYSDVEGVYYNETNGCINFNTNEPTHIVDLVDKLIYGVVTSD